MEVTYDSHLTRTVLDMEVEGVRPRGRPTSRYMNTIRRDIKMNGLTDIKGLENGSKQGDPLMWKCLQGEKKVKRLSMLLSPDREYILLEQLYADKGIVPILCANLS